MAEIYRPRPIEQSTIVTPARLELKPFQFVDFALPVQPTVEAQRIRRTMFRAPRDGRR